MHAAEPTRHHHPLHAEVEATTAEWLLQALRPLQWRNDALEVGAFVPDTFQAIGRVLHPWSAGDRPGERPVTWAGAAARLGESTPAALDRRRRGHTLPAIAGLQEPAAGELDPATAATLVSALAHATDTTEDVFVAVWVGWGDRPQDGFPTAAFVPTPKRGHFLLRGPLDGVLDPIGDRRLPSGIWWPADRAWVVTTEVDYHWTFVAGSTTLIDTLTGDSRLEVLRTHPDAAANHLAEDDYTGPAGPP